MRQEGKFHNFETFQGKDKKVSLLRIVSKVEKGAPYVMTQVNQEDLKTLRDLLKAEVLD